jgi:pimeloyl-ACP methyl ester carboxylesterase
MLEFARVGNGIPVLYFHGTGAGNDLVLVMEHRLLEDGFQLIVPNRAGYYGTPIDCGRSAAACADLSADLLDALDIQRVAVIGTSGGGPPAANFASRFPERTSALVLQCAQTHRWDGPSWLPHGRGWLYPFLRQPRLRGILNRVHFLEIRWQRIFPSGYLKLMCGQRLAEVRNDPAAYELCRVMVKSSVQCLAHPAGIDNDLSILLDSDWIQPGGITCPTLVIFDRLDPLVPVCHAEWAIRCISGAEWCEVHAGGHLLWIGTEAAHMHQTRVDFLRRHHYGRDTLASAASEL